LSIKRALDAVRHAFPEVEFARQATVEFYR
jgi:hypothetical protein